MLKKLIIYGCLYFLFNVLILSSLAEAGSLSATFGDGKVYLTGSATFECDPQGYDFLSMAIIYNNYVSPPFSETIKSDSSTVNVNTHDDMNCEKPGTYTYVANYTGGLLYQIPPYCRMAGTPTVYAPVDVPLWPDISINTASERVTGQMLINVSYSFFPTFNYNRTIYVTIGSETIYSGSNLSDSGNLAIPYDFSNKKGFVLIRVKAGCGNHSRFVEELVYVEPDDTGPDCQLGVGKPVNTANGNVFIAEKDFSIAGIIPVDFTRYYNSTESLTRGFGQSWGHTFDIRVSSFGINTYKVINSDGSIVYYIDNDGDKIYNPELPKGQNSWLVKNTNNTFYREFLDGRKEEFNTSGYLTAVVDRNGNRITLTRGSNNYLEKITDPYGREINITNNTSGKITSINLPDGRTYNYTYLSGTGFLGKVTYSDSSEENYEYVYISGLGYRLTGIKDENRNYIEKHTYDSQGRAITSSADGTNEKLTISYLSDTQSTVTDSLGRITTYTIDKTLGQSHPTNISGPGCTSCGQGNVSYAYDDNLNITSFTDANGNVTVMTYDADGNMLTKTEAYGTADQRTTTYTYNEFGQVLTETDNDGNITSYTYDTNGNMLAKTEAYGTVDERTTTYTYNVYGQILTITDPSGNTTSNTYDQYGNLASTTNALNQTTTYTYDIMGNLLSMTDANGNTTTYQYDLRDRLIRETKPDGGAINYEYDLTGNRTAVIDTNGNRTTYTYDTINRLIKIIDPEGNSTNYTYDSEGNMTSMTIKDSLNNVKTSETYTYDIYNRLTRTTHADGTYTEQSYDAIGNILTKRDENGNITTFSYDALNRLLSVNDPNTKVTSYTYDRRNNLTSVTDANLNITTYTYDSLNRLILTASPDTGTTTYSYDPNGNMTSKTDASNITTTHVYDALNRLITIQFPDSTQNINYYYDDTQMQNSKGRLTAMTDPSGTTWYDYDKMGRVTMETRQINNLNYRTSYTYDLNGNVSSITYPGGRKITYTYNALNKINSVTETYLGVTRTLASNIIYQPFGDIASITYGNGIVTNKTFDDRYQLSNLGIGTIKQLSYTRDNVGNITGITDTLNPSNTKSYTYDNLYRLTLSTGSWGAITYAYDSVGNRTYETTNTGNTTYSYTVNTNKLASVFGEKNLSFSYDNNGNTTAENTKQYIYNQNQRMIRIADTTGTVAEYIYNGNGQRADKLIPSENKCTVFHYDKNGLLVTESTRTGNIKSEYVYLNGQPLAKIEGNNIYYYHNDHLGTPMVMTDSSGSVVWQGEYLPFGEPLSVSGTITNNLRFPGQYYDSETGLHQNGYRDYKSEIGRYPQADPIGIEEGNNHLFVYVGNNPVNFVDPLGLEKAECIKNTKKCIGTARVLKGNARHIGKAGGFSTATTNIIISSTSAAVDPSQWGGKANLRPNISQISGKSNGTELFSNVAEVIGGESPCLGLNVRDCLRNRYPGKLIVELPGAKKDLGIVPIEITIPSSLSCPEGTKEVK